MKPVIGLLCQLGIRVIYLDDMLIMAETQEMAKCHAAMTVNLLESLGFTVNYQKSVLLPTTTIEFLGFLVDSKTLTLSLPKGQDKESEKSMSVNFRQPTAINTTTFPNFGLPKRPPFRQSSLHQFIFGTYKSTRTKP